MQTAMTKTTALRVTPITRLTDQPAVAHGKEGYVALITQATLYRGKPVLRWCAEDSHLLGFLE